MTDVSEDLLAVESAFDVERECLKLTLRRAKLHLRQLKQRQNAFWAQPNHVLHDEDLRIAAQQQIWTQHRAVREHGCLQPLSTCVAELRRWQGVQRAAHDRKCAQLRSRRDAEEGDLQWRIFCARLAHDSCGALTVTPLTPEQTRFCDSTAAPQLQPRAKAKDPRVFTVVRAASIAATRPSGPGREGPASARSTRGLVVGDLCQASSQVERLLSRLIGMALSASDALALANAPGTSVPTAPAPVPSKPAKGDKGKDSGTKKKSDRMASGGGGGGGGGGEGGGEVGASAVAAATAAAFALPGKRLPLFPMAMRLSSECLGWLRGKHEGTSSDRHVYYVVEEIDTPNATLGRRGGVGGGASTHVLGEPLVKRPFAERLARQPELTATIDVGVDLCLVLPDSLAASPHAPQKQLHLRPAAVEHLLAIDCLWPSLAAADREALTSCYTPRAGASSAFSQHAPRLTTLYTPLSDGVQTELERDGPHDAFGTTRRLRPLRPAELAELMRVYVVREPQPTAAMQALPLATPADGGVGGDARQQTLPPPHNDDSLLHHIYCPLNSPPGTGGPMQVYLLQLLPAAAAAEESAFTALDEPIPAPPLVEMCQNGMLQAALSERASARLVHACPSAPSQATKALEALLQGSQKARELAAETARATREALPDAAVDMSPERIASPSLDSHRSRGRSKATQKL